MGKFVMELSSNIDKDSFFYAQTCKLKELVEAKHPGKAVYLPYEIPFLKNLDSETLKKVHLLKKNFQGLILNSSMKNNSQYVKNYSRKEANVCIFN